MKNSARRPPPNRHGPLKKLAQGCEGCPMMANRSDRRFPNLPGVQAPRGRWSDTEKTRGFPSWPGAIVAPSKARIHERNRNRLTDGHLARGAGSIQTPKIGQLSPAGLDR